VFKNKKIRYEQKMKNILTITAEGNIGQVYNFFFTWLIVSYLIFDILVTTLLYIPTLILILLSSYDDIIVKYHY